MSLLIKSGFTIGPNVKLWSGRGLNVISQGLILDLDARDSRSYPGSGDTWYDISGNGYNATLFNGVTYGSENGGALSFSGVDTAPPPGDPGTDQQYAQLPPNVYFNGDFTISSWVYVTNNSNNWARIIDFGNGPAADTVLLASTFGTTGQPGFYCEGDEFASSKVIDLDAWNNVCATLSGNTATIYVNGIDTGSQAVTPPANVVRQYCYIGRSEWAGDGMFQGGIGALQIYDRALTSEEMLQNYNSTKSQYSPLGT